MRLGAPSLTYAEASAHQLAEDAAALLRRTTRAVLEVVELRLLAIDVALSMGTPELLGDQRSWEVARLRNDEVDLTPVDIDHAVLQVLAEHVDPDVLDDIDRLQSLTATTLFTSLDQTRTIIDPELTPLARAYVEHAVAGRREEALALVRDARERGMEPPDVVRTVLEPAQAEVGRLWAEGDLSIAHEQHVTSLTQLCMSMLYPVVPRQRDTDAPRLVALTVGPEGHELGMRMVTDLMQHEGWNVAYLGAGLPVREAVNFIVGTRPDVVAVSATMAAHVLSVRELITAIRDEPGCAGIRVLIGGRPFALNPRLQASVDADGWAPGPREALQLCWLWVRRDTSLAT